MSTPETAPAPWWRFSLRWVFVATAVVAAFCACFARTWVRQAQVRGLIAELRARGHEAYTDPLYDLHDPPPASWTDFFLDYPTVYIVAIKPTDRDFATFPWDSLAALGDIRRLSLNHPDLRDEDLAQVARHPNLYAIGLVGNPRLTAAGTGALAQCKHLSSIGIESRDLAPDAWRFLESLPDGTDIGLGIRPDQIEAVARHLRSECDRLSLWEDFDGIDQSPAIATYPTARIDFVLPEKVKVRHLTIMGGWVREEALVQLIEQHPEVAFVEAHVDHVTSKSLNALRDEHPYLWVNTLDVTPEVIACKANHHIRIPRLTQELATAWSSRTGNSSLEIIVPGPQFLPADMRGLDVTTFGNDVTVRRPPDVPPSAPPPVGE